MFLNFISNVCIDTTKYTLNLLYFRIIPKQVFLQTVKIQMKCSIL